MSVTEIIPAEAPGPAGAPGRANGSSPLDAPRPVPDASFPAAVAQGPTFSFPRLTKRRVAFVLIALAAFLLGFVGYELGLSGVTQARAQRLLLARFQGLADGGLASTVEWQPAPGDPVAIIAIPRIGLRAVVVEGTSPSETSQGPGHYRASPLPGRPGNSVVAARRSTFGAPFERLAELQEGDSIAVTTGVGTFVYRVAGVGELAPGDEDVVNQTPENRLTLMTAAPPYRASRRLVAIAELQGEPAPQPLQPPVTVAPDEVGLSGEPWALAPLILWGQAFLVVLLAGAWISRRISPRVAWLLGAPLAVTLLWASFGALNRLLPATI